MHNRSMGLLVVALVLSGCADDATGPDGPDVAELAGRWELTLFEWRNNANPQERVDAFQEVGIAFDSLFIEESGRFVHDLVLSDGRTFQSRGRIILSQDSLTLQNDDGSAATLGYTLSGDVLTLMDGDQEFDFDPFDESVDSATAVLRYERAVRLSRVSGEARYGLAPEGADAPLRIGSLRSGERLARANG